jgi:hypothetical protein
MMRARPFSHLLFLLEQAVPDPLDQQKYFATAQVYFDRIDPATYAPWLIREALPGMKADRRVLMQAGLGDVEVPNIGTFFHARMLGLPLLEPAPSAVFGLEAATGPIVGSAFALYDFGVDLDAAYRKAEPADFETPVHDHLKEQPAVLEQWKRFFREESSISSACAGPCDPN